MGYSQWRDFATVVKKAKESLALVQGNAAAEDHFAETRNMVSIGSKAQRGAQDYHLTRFGAYLTAMAGDDTKEAVAHARVYFAVQTRAAEVAKPASPALPQDYEEALVALLGKVRENKSLTAQVAELEPSAHAWDTLASGDGSYRVSDAAKILDNDPTINTGPRKLFVTLAENGWTYTQKGDGKPRAKQYVIERGWLAEIPQSYEHPHTGVRIIGVPQIRVTIKGLRKLHELMGGSAQLRLS
jgi:phage antirepressor YoqD-like protein